MKLSRLLIVALASLSPLFVSAAVTPADALQNLQQGNARFTSGQSTHPNLTADRRTEVAKGQTPFATKP